MFGGGRRITRRGHGDNIRRHWTLEEALLRLCRVIITRQCVSLSPVPAITQHADCRLTAWTCVLQIYICVHVLRIIKVSLLPNLLSFAVKLTYYEFSLTRVVTWGTCHVSRFSPESRDNVSHVMSWAGAGHRSAFVRCLHYTLSLFVRNIEHNPHATSNGLKVDIFRKIVNYF